MLTLKPKLGATDFNPFILQVMSAGCDGVLSACGAHFVSWVKRARCLASSTRSRDFGRDRQPRDRRRAQERVPGQRDLQHLRALVPRQRPPHKSSQAKARQETPQWAVLGYIGVMYAAAAMEKAKSTDPDKVAARSKGFGSARRSASSPSTPEPPGQHRPILGPMVKKPDRAYRMMDPAEYIQPK